MRRRNARFVLAAVVVSISVLACAGRDVDLGANGEPSLLLPTEMVIMPVTDERPPGPDAVDVSREVRNAAVRLLKKRGYTATPRDELEKGGVAAAPTLIGVTGSALAALGPRDAGSLVFLAVDQVVEGYGYGGDEYHVVLSAVIVDPKSGSIVWRGKGSGATSLGGLLRIFTPQSTAYDAVYTAVRNVFRSLPKAAA